jgi:hypothetical protein
MSNKWPGIGLYLLTFIIGAIVFHLLPSEGSWRYVLGIVIGSIATRISIAIIEGKPWR